MFSHFVGPETQMFQSALRAWNIYAGTTNPPSYENQYYYHFETGAAAFFVFDTQYHRSKDSQLGRGQMEAFYAWVLSVNQTAAFKFLVSPNPVTLNYLGKVGWGSAQTEVRFIFLEDRLHDSLIEK